MEKFFTHAWKVISRFFENFNWEGLLIMIIILVGGYFATKAFTKVVRKGLDKANIDFSLSKFLVNAIKIACYVVIIMSALSYIGISTTGLVAFFSASAAAIALALKDSLSNIACGIILLFTKPFVTDDVIEINGERCTVLQIDLMHTKVLTADHRCIMIPNSVISSKEVVNFTAEDKRRLDFHVPVDYNADIEEVKKILMDVALSNDKVITDEDMPFVRLNALGDSSLDMVVKVWVKTEDYWDVYHDMIESMKKALDRNNIAIPYNQLDVHITK